MPRTQALRFAIRQRSPYSHHSLPLPWHQQPSFFSGHPRSGQLPLAHRILSRRFSHHPLLLNLYRQQLSRPQLPFLHPSSAQYRAHLKRSFLTRYLSTERKQRWKQTLRWQLRFQAYLWPTLILVSIILTGIRQAELERRYPTPRSWGFWSRWYLRCGLFEEERCDTIGGGYLREGWATVARYYSGVLQRCEEELEKLHQTRDDESVLVAGVGKIGGGADLSEATDEWKRGYYQALMGCARCAENLEGMAKKKGEEFGKLFPWESIIGPSNPRPKPLPWDKKGGHKAPPTEDEVEDAFAQPEIYYMKILTNRGFTDRQRLDAAVAYADYLDFKGLYDSAGDMYDWAIDIAAGGLPLGANNVVDMNSGIINQGKDQFVTENMFKATTALGLHYARMRDVQSALPIFLSVLRARRRLDPAPPDVQKQLDQKKQKTRAQDISIVERYWKTLSSFVIEEPYPSLPSDGNNRPYHSLSEACEEVGLMIYIGEILFASSSTEREKGLSWTRDSVGAAEAVLWVMDERRDSEGGNRCRECLETGLENWKNMTRSMAKLAKDKVAQVESSSGWFGLGLGKADQLRKVQDDAAKWEEEEAQIELRQLKTASLVHPVRPPA